MKVLQLSQKCTDKNFDGKEFAAKAKLGLEEFRQIRRRKRKTETSEFKSGTEERKEESMLLTVGDQVKF